MNAKPSLTFRVMKRGHPAILLVVTTLLGCGARKESLSDVLHVSIRPSVLSSSDGVLQIENRSDEPLVLLGVVRNLDSNQEMTFSTGTIRPSEMKEIGWLEIGWKFEPNERIALCVPGNEKFSIAGYATFRAENGSVGIEEDTQ